MDNMNVEEKEEYDNVSSSDIESNEIRNGDETSIYMSNVVMVDDSFVCNNIETPKKQQSSGWENVMVVCCITITSFTLIFGSIVYYVFGILYLIEDYKKFKDCKSSNLWIYVLVSMILAFANIRSNVKKEEEDTNRPFTLVNFVLNLILCIFGGIELFTDNKLCANLDDSSLWTFALVSFTLQIFGGLMCCVFFAFS
jgi:hypothetical protein